MPREGSRTVLLWIVVAYNHVFCVPAEPPPGEKNYSSFKLEWLASLWAHARQQMSQRLGFGAALTFLGKRPSRSEIQGGADQHDLRKPLMYVSELVSSLRRGLL